MIETAEAHNGADPSDLARFTDAQAQSYATVRSELRNGRKRTHWMWYIFPQASGLGYSAMSKRYAIHSLEEARHFLAHPVLGARLRECATAVLTVQGRSVSEIFGSPDDMKLQSSMTLFASAAGAESVFVRVLEKCFGGKRDAKTLRWLEESAGEGAEQ